MDFFILGFAQKGGPDENNKVDERFVCSRVYFRDNRLWWRQIC